MLGKLSSKSVLIVIGCAAAIVVAGAATALASRSSATVSAASRPAVVAAPQSPAAAARDAEPESASVREAIESAALPSRPVAAAPAFDDASEAREFAAGVVRAAKATPAPQAAAERSAPGAAVASPEPSETPETEHPAEVEFKGSIDSLSPLVVGGRAVTTNAQTIVENGPLALNQWVEVEGFAQADGSVLAKKIEVEHTGEPGDDDVAEVEFKAPIVSFPSAPYVGTWLIGSYTVNVTATAVVDTSRGMPAIGAIAEVKAMQKADGTLEALRIKIEDAVEFENEVEFKGVISGLSGSAPEYTMTVAGHTVKTDGGTLIDGALADGKFVEVSGSLRPEGWVLAKRIHVEDPAAPPDELQFRARVTGIAGSVWSFDGGNPDVTVDAGTLIDQSRGPAVVGALVEVKAIKQGALWLALRIQVEND